MPDDATKRCPLCGDDYHAEPDSQADIFGLICPGDAADPATKEIYLSALAKAFADYVADEFITLADKISERKRLWYERTRDPAVTQDVLQSDCDNRVQDAKAAQPWLRVTPNTPDEVIAAQLAADELSRGLEVDPAHLMVPAKVPAPKRALVRDPSLGLPLEQLSAEQKSKETDALLFINDQEIS